MRRLVVIALALLVCLAVATGASARVLRDIGAQAGQLEVQDGAGTVVISMARGALIGRLDHGRLVVTDRRGAAEVTVFGAEETIETKERTTIYRGDEIRFKISGQGWRVGIQGTGLDASLVGRGVVTLRGTGMASFDGEPFKPWPLEFRSLVLGG